LNNDLISWGQALDTLTQFIQSLQKNGQTNKIAVLASARLTNEDLFVVKKLFDDHLKTAHMDFRMTEKPGDGDQFLMKPDKNPNTAGALAILDPGTSTQQIIEKAKNGEVDILYVFGHDLVKLFGQEAVQQIAKKVKLFVFQGSNINATCGYAHLILPSTVYAEKDGTFTNVQQRVQRIWPAFPPLGESKGDWEILAALGNRLGISLPYKKSQDIFEDIAGSNDRFAQMSYEKIADQGMVLK
jgi:predicted molibdopterin-dependent oxidoreductase YjgC